jgi:uncharacterized membrane protein YhaH (DUF805 family)
MTFNGKAILAFVAFVVIVGVATNQAVFGVALAIAAAVAIEVLTLLGILGPARKADRS